MPHNYSSHEGWAVILCGLLFNVALCLFGFKIYVTLVSNLKNTQFFLFMFWPQVCKSYILIQSVSVSN